MFYAIFGALLFLGGGIYAAPTNRSYGNTTALPILSSDGYSVLRANLSSLRQRYLGLLSVVEEQVAYSNATSYKFESMRRYIDRLLLVRTTAQPGTTEQISRVDGKLLSNITTRGGTIKTNCPIAAHLIKWTDYVRITDLGQLNGQEFLTMVVLRNGPQSRYYRGTLTFMSVIPDSEFFGYIRASNGDRYLLVPIIEPDDVCTQTVVNTQVKSFPRTAGNKQRIWKTFVQKLTLGYSLVSYDNILFEHHVEDPNDSAFVSLRLLPTFFKIVSRKQTSEIPEVVSRWFKQTKAKEDRRRRRAAPYIDPKSPLIKEVTLTAKQCDTLMGPATKMFQAPTFGSKTIRLKLPQLCYDLVYSTKNCVVLDKLYPGWRSCRFNALRCMVQVNSAGDPLDLSTDGESGSNMEDILGARTISRVVGLQAYCTQATILSNMYNLDSDIYKNLQAGTTEFREHAKLYSLHLGTLIGFINNTDSNMVGLQSTYRAIQGNTIINNNALKFMRNETMLIKNQLATVTAILQRLGIEDARMQIQRDAYIDAKIANLEAFAQKVGPILHVDFDNHVNVTPKYESLSSLHYLMEKLSNDSEALSNLRHNVSQKFQQDLDFKILLNRGALNDSRRQQELTNLAINKSEIRSRKMRGQQMWIKGAINSTNQRLNKDIAKPLILNGARIAGISDSLKNPFGGASTGLQIAGGLGAAGAGGFGILLVIVILFCVCKGKD